MSFAEPLREKPKEQLPNCSNLSFVHLEIPVRLSIIWVEANGSYGRVGSAQTCMATGFKPMDQYECWKTQDYDGIKRYRNFPEMSAVEWMEAASKGPCPYAFEGIFPVYALTRHLGRLTNLRELHFLPSDAWTDGELWDRIQERAVFMARHDPTFPERLRSRFGHYKKSNIGELVKSAIKSPVCGEATIPPYAPESPQDAPGRVLTPKTGNDTNGPILSTFEQAGETGAWPEDFQ